MEWLDRKDHSSLARSEEYRKIEGSFRASNSVARLYLDSATVVSSLPTPTEPALRNYIGNLPQVRSKTELELLSNGVRLKSVSLLSYASAASDNLLAALKQAIPNASIKYLPKEVAAFATINLSVVSELISELDLGPIRELTGAVQGEGLFAAVTDANGKVSEDNVFFAVHQKSPSALIDVFAARTAGQLGRRQVFRHRNHNISCFQQFFGNRMCYFEIDDFAFLAPSQQVLRKVADVKDGLAQRFEDVLKSDAKLRKTLSGSNNGVLYVDLRSSFRQEEMVREFGVNLNKLLSGTTPFYLVSSTSIRVDEDIIKGEVTVSGQTGEFEDLFAEIVTTRFQAYRGRGIAAEKIVVQKPREDKVIKKGSIVSFEYTLTDEGGTVIESNKGKEPMVYTHGQNQIIPGLEKELAGLSEGIQKNVKVKPEDAYGLVDPKAFQEIPRADVPPEALKVGTMLVAKSQEGQSFPARVSEIKEQTVVLDFNHPLAGKTLTFDVKILNVKQPEPK